MSKYGNEICWKQGTAWKEHRKGKCERNLTAKATYFGGDDKAEQPLVTSFIKREKKNTVEPVMGAKKTNYDELLSIEVHQISICYGPM